MKKKIIKVSLILLSIALIFITSFNLILKDKSTFSLRAEEYNYSDIEYLYFKEENGIKKLYFNFKNESDYYMVVKSLKISLSYNEGGVNSSIDLGGHRQSYYLNNKSTIRHSIYPGEEEVYFFEIPMGINLDKINIDNLFYFSEFALYLKGKDNYVFKEIFTISQGKDIEIDTKLLNN